MCCGLHVRTEGWWWADPPLIPCDWQQRTTREGSQRQRHEDQPQLQHRLHSPLLSHPADKKGARDVVIWDHDHLLPKLWLLTPGTNTHVVSAKKKEEEVGPSSDSGGEVQVPFGERKRASSRPLQRKAKNILFHIIISGSSSDIVTRV